MDTRIEGQGVRVRPGIMWLAPVLEVQIDGGSFAGANAGGVAHKGRLTCAFIRGRHSYLSDNDIQNRFQT
ncbi:MAG: hypothetical protein AAGI88_18985 [Pseudomonadota bacterium]